MKNTVISNIDLWYSLGNMQGKKYKRIVSNSIVASIKNITNIEKSNDSNLNVMKYETWNLLYKYKF